jgi:CRISPR-associated protein Cmr6
MRTSIIALASRRGQGQHPGLLLQRFLSASATGEDGNPEEKRDLLNAAIAAAGSADLRTLYQAAFERWQKSLPGLTTANDFASAGRLIVGLGSENVLETGIRLHHTYGLPVIPGSALKGLAAHYCHEVWGRLSPGDAPAESKRFRRDGEATDFKYHQLLFGATEDTGCITFHDAWLKPDSRNPLRMDVMTPHHPKWIDGSKAPTDFDSPNPVPFVSVHGTFHIAVTWNGPGATQASDWTNLAFNLLAEALKEWGVGGKTSSGYGRLVESNPNERKKAFSAAALGLPEKGEVVTAVLLKTPKPSQPWRARIVLRSGKELSGPIEPLEGAPMDAASDRSIRLRVIHIDEKSIRFTWTK